MKYKLLSRINYPKDLKNFTIKELEDLAKEIRKKIVETTSKTGGHLGSSLGTVELTLAIHKVFDTPKDRLIWDVGHQAYTHKIITGRKKEFENQRQPEGISGFPKRSESEYDAFGVGHSSTSISAGLGMAVANNLLKKNNNAISVIGDGAMSSGMAYEAINNAGHIKKKMIVILNDNEMSIAPAIGAMSTYLAKLISSKPYQSVRTITKHILEKWPETIMKTAQRAERTLRKSVRGSNIFEDLGFYYIGPVDGHDLKLLTALLTNIKEGGLDIPILIHAITKKGKGYKPAEEAKDRLHGVSKFDIVTGKSHKKPTKPTYTQVFSQTLVQEAKKDDKIVAITAAMSQGTGLDQFAKEFPERSFDVGIAEQHAVTFAAGLASEGLKPFCAIYSTFLQRGYDQILHDVALQKLPVRFAIDRAGFVGDDGATHHGVFDTAFLSMIPNIIIMSPSNGKELQRAIKTSLLIDSQPSAFRYPRGEITSNKLLKRITPFKIGKGKIIKQGEKTAIISLGAILKNSIEAGKTLEKQHNIRPTIIDARFAKPIDTDLIKKVAKTHKNILIVEEGYIGGFSSAVLDFLANNNLFGKDKKVRTLIIPDKFMDHNSVENLYKLSKIDTQNIIEKVLELK